MAVTIIEQPQSHTPIYNDQVFVLQGPLFAPPKYIICLDVSIVLEGGSETYLGRLKSPTVISYQAPRAGLYTYFNLKELIKQSMFFGTKSNFLAGDISHLIKVIPGEEYAASPSGAATYYPSSANIQYVGFNGALRLDEFRQFVPTDLINTTTIAASSGIGQYIMSSYTQPKNILKSTINELTFLCNGGTNTRATVSYYGGSGLISTQIVPCSTANRTDITINASYNALAVPPSAYLIGVKLERISNGEWLTTQYLYNLVEACSKYPTLNVYFQNKWGAYDSFIFNKKSTKRDSINRKTYQKQDRYINTYNSYDPAIRTYDSEIKTRHTLSTDWVTEEEMNWLSELVESNNVQFSYDSDVVFGSKSEVEITLTGLPDIGGDPYINSGWTFTINTNSGNFTYTQAANTNPVPNEADVADELLPFIQASTIGTNYNVINTSGTNLKFKLVAKNNGAQYTINTITASNYATFSAITPRVTEVMPTTIPIQIEDTSFEFKTRDNDKLFQLTINAVETSVYNRQNL